MTGQKEWASEKLNRDVIASASGTTADGINTQMERVGEFLVTIVSGIKEYSSLNGMGMDLM